MTILYCNELVIEDNINIMRLDPFINPIFENYNYIFWILIKCLLEYLSLITKGQNEMGVKCPREYFLPAQLPFTFFIIVSVLKAFFYYNFRIYIHYILYSLFLFKCINTCNTKIKVQDDSPFLFSIRGKNLNSWKLA